MAVALDLRHALRGSDGFRVVTADVGLGSVEEVWLGEDGEPTGVAVRTASGKRGLVLADDVSAVDAERRWVVFDPGARVLELEPPVVHSREQGRLEAAWSTSGGTIELRPPPRHRRHHEPPPAGDPPLLRSIALLYAGLAAVVTVVMALAFVIPYLVA